MILPSDRLPNSTLRTDAAATEVLVVPDEAVTMMKKWELPVPPLPHLPEI